MDLQAAARAHRIGQTRPVKIIRLVAKSTVEEVILTRAEAKLKLTHSVISDQSSSGELATSIFTQLYPVYRIHSTVLTLPYSPYRTRPTVLALLHHTSCIIIVLTAKTSTLCTTLKTRNLCWVMNIVLRCYFRSRLHTRAW